MAEMEKDALDLFDDPEASKVMASVDKGGTLNIVPKGSLNAIDGETIAYAEIVGGKTKENLESTGKVAITVFKMGMPPVGYQVKGTFQGFQTSGDLFDKFAGMIKERIKVDIKAVGTIKVDEVYAVSPAEAGKKLA